VEFRDAEDLLRRLTADSVWLVLESTRAQVGRLRDELRTLISGRYHDLIDSADAIVGMDKTVDSFKVLAAAVEKEASAIAETDDAALSALLEAAPSDSNNEEKEGLNPFERDLRAADLLTHAAVDIWEVIDSKNLWKACQRFLETEEAFQALKGDEALRIQRSKKLEPVEEEISDAFRVLDISMDEFQELRFNGARENPKTPDEQSIWDIYPFLKSHWALVQESKSRIINEAKAALENEEYGSEVTTGAIRALIALKHVTVLESLEMLLEARARLLEMLCQNKTEDFKNRVSGVLQQTILDVNDLYLSSEKAVGNIGAGEVKTKISKWLQAQRVELTHGVRASLANASEIEKLAEEQVRLSDMSLETTDTEIWEQAVVACVDPDILEIPLEGGRNFLFFLLFATAFVDQASTILAKSFEDACKDFQGTIQKVLMRVKQEDPSEKGETSSLEDDVQAEEDEIYHRSLATLVSAEDALQRTVAVAMIAHSFASQIDHIKMQKERFAMSKELLQVEYASKCEEGALGLLQYLQRELNEMMEVYKSVFTELGDEPKVVESLKLILFLGRISESMVALQDESLGFLDESFRYNSRGLLNTISAKANEIWIQSTLSLCNSCLATELEKLSWNHKRDWHALHRSWERIRMGFSEKSSEEQEDESEEEDIFLPSSVSAGAAVYSFLLAKQLRMLGDSKYIPSGPALEKQHEKQMRAFGWQIETDLNLGLCQSMSLEFCKSTKAAIESLCNLSFSAVSSMYRSYLAEHKEADNQLAGLQTIFDLLWFDWLLCIRNQGKNELQELVDEVLMDHVDSVDWELCEKIFHSRFIAYRRRNSLLFGAILLVKAENKPSDPVEGKADKQATSTIDNDNVLYLGHLGTNTLPRIPLLPIPSSFRMQHRSAMVSKAPRMGPATLGSPHQKAKTSSAFQDDATKALKSIGQVGSNFLSQASSFFNR